MGGDKGTNRRRQRDDEEQRWTLRGEFHIVYLHSVIIMQMETCIILYITSIIEKIKM